LSSSASKGEIGQVNCWDRGRPARKRAAGAQSFRKWLAISFSRFALICGRDARGPSNSLEWSLANKKAASPENYTGLAAFFEEPTYLDYLNARTRNRFQYRSGAV